MLCIRVYSKGLDERLGEGETRGETRKGKGEVGSAMRVLTDDSVSWARLDLRGEERAGSSPLHCVDGANRQKKVQRPIPTSESCGEGEGV